jgi:general secretion pathway protein J
MTRGRRPDGFTLVELLIALALTGIVALLMLEGVRFSALGLGRLSDLADRLEARRSLEDLLRRELGAVTVAPLLATVPALVGEPQSLQFLTLANDTGAGLYRVKLAIETRGDTRQLVLTRRRIDAPATADAQRAVLVPRLRDLRIAYFGAATPGSDAQWQEEWTGRRDPPALVRFAFDAGDGLARPPLIVRLWAAAR